jgi:hypothetical protein
MGYFKNFDNDYNASESMFLKVITVVSLLLLVIIVIMEPYKETKTTVELECQSISSTSILCVTK